MKTFLGAIALATAGCAAHSTPSHPTEVSTEQLAAQIDGLEAASGGRLGLALFSKDEGLLFAHRGAERFAMCSTFKLALAAMALETVVIAGCLGVALPMALAINPQLMSLDVDNLEPEFRNLTDAASGERVRHVYAAKGL